MENPNEEIIDLTLDQQPLCGKECTRNKRRAIWEGVIDLVNEPCNAEKSTNSVEISCKRKAKENDEPKKTIEKDKDKDSTKPGLCSICWDRLGKRPLASTKCGHVYCLMCIEKSLKCNKRCPTCRCMLKGALAYHPLYLELG